MSALLCASPALALQDVRVLATGVDRSSGRAQELALDYAKKRAVYLVARKMEIKDPSTELSKLKEDQWREIVRGAKIVQTRRVGDITYADVTVSVMDDVLRRVLKLEDPKADIPAPGHVDHGVLVLPVYVGTDRPFVWEADNVMNAPVRTEILRQSRGAVLAAAADFDDRRLIDYQNALEVKPDELKPMFTRYGIDEIIIAITSFGPEGTTEPTSIILRRLAKPPGESRVEQISLKSLGEKATIKEKAEQAAVAIGAAATQIATATSVLEQAELQGAKTIPVRFRFATATDLGAMQETLRRAPNVMLLSMPTISLDDMHGTIYFSGDTGPARQALLKAGFRVIEGADGSWVIAAH